MSRKVASGFPESKSPVKPEDTSMLNRAVHPSTKFESPWTYSGLIVGCTYVLLLVVCAFFNTTFILWPVTLLQRTHILSARSCRHVFCFFEAKYFAMLSGCLEVLGGVKIVLSGDVKVQFQPREHVLLICNHRTEVDWIFFWSFALRFGAHDRLRVMLKSGIRYVPGVGWAMLLLQFPYINRNWATDQDRLNKVIQSYKDVEIGSWLAVFPEGTALYDKSLQKSHEFAEMQGEASWNYVLQPRIKGFELCMEKLDPDFVVDVTVAYPELRHGIRPSPKRFLRGQFPTEVHMHVKRYHRSLLRKHKDKMGKWLKDRFAEKEERLRTFYERGVFQGQQCVRQDLPLWSSVVPGIAFNLLLCGVALYLSINFCFVTFTMFALSAALSMVQAQNFGD